ncbi:hypothetical protein CEXT_342961 [Caerostris extrusa]|uniref:Uncharacterized protein n=1 Tax=Caerostris extrusa TaxID=172846 RepID=A0AAV4SCR3_CAEEX|nr:hypothetical protein CEXT_342961 [Caerostris extrusa]
MFPAAVARSLWLRRPKPPSRCSEEFYFYLESKMGGIEKERASLVVDEAVDLALRNLIRHSRREAGPKALVSMLEMDAKIVIQKIPSVGLEKSAYIRIVVAVFSIEMEEIQQYCGTKLSHLSEIDPFTEQLFTEIAHSLFHDGITLIKIGFLLSLAKHTIVRNPDKKEFVHEQKRGSEVNFGSGNCKGGQAIFLEKRPDLATDIGCLPGLWKTPRRVLASHNPLEATGCSNRIATARRVNNNH